MVKESELVKALETVKGYCEGRECLECKLYKNNCCFVKRHVPVDWNFPRLKSNIVKITPNRYVDVVGKQIKETLTKNKMLVEDFKTVLIYMSVDILTTVSANIAANIFGEYKDEAADIAIEINLDDVKKQFEKNFSKIPEIGILTKDVLNNLKDAIINELQIKEEE